MAKKDPLAKKTFRSSHRVDSGYFVGTHKLTDTIQLLKGLLDQYGPDADIELAVLDYDDYYHDVEVYVHNLRIETDEEYAKRMSRLKASRAANAQRAKKLKDKKEKAAQQLKEQEQAELLRLMRKYPEIRSEDAHEWRKNHMIPAHLARAAKVVKK